MLDSMAGKMGGVKTKSIALGSAIGNMANNLATKLAELPGQALGMGDSLMSMRARIDNINDGMQTTDELMEKCTYLLYAHVLLMSIQQPLLQNWDLMPLTLSETLMK